MTPQQPSEKEAFARGFRGIPDDAKLKAMSFVELACELALCESGTSKFIVIEREMKIHLAKDQAKINLPNMLWAAGFGGVFALAGVVLGWYLNTTPPSDQVAPANTMQQIENSNLDKQNIVTRVEKPNAESTPAPVIPRTEKPSVVDAGNTKKNPDKVQSNENPSH